MKIINNPWKGLLTYTINDSCKFCGRDIETEQLTSLIEYNQVVTLYGKSGIGKSSLLNAGVYPLLCLNDYKPYDIVLKNDSSNYAKDIIAKLGLDTPDLDYDKETVFCDCFMKYAIADNGFLKTPVFILDQFETIFRKDKQKAEFLLRQIAKWIDFTGIRKTDCHFVLSVREDDLYRLEDCIDNSNLNRLKNCRYRLHNLTEQGAREIIRIPGEGFYEPNEIEQIEEKIIAMVRDEDSNIRTNLLSLVCNRIFNDYKNRNSKYIDLSLVNSYTKDELIENYYREAIKNLSKDEIYFIENKLVDATGYRYSVSKEELKENIKNPQSLFEGDFQILQEAKDSSDRVELIHDSFCECVKKSREIRKLSRNQRRWRFLIFMFPFLLLFIILFYLAMPSSTVRLSFNKFVLADDEYLNLSEISGKKVLYPSNAMEDSTININAIGNSFFENVLVGAECRMVNFSSCPNLSKVKIHKRNTVGLFKGEVYFDNCPQLKYVELDDFLTTIDGFFINNCPQLKSIRIPSRVSFISPLAFESEDLCIDVAADNKRFVWKDGILWDLKSSKNPIVFVQNKILSATNRIPFIQDYRFKDSIIFRGRTLYPIKDEVCPILLNEDSTKLLPSVAYQFYEKVDLSGLTKIKSIPEGLFSGCRNLERIIFPPKLEIIEKEAFYGCESLYYINFPQSLRDIGSSAFEGCKQLKYIFFRGDVSSIGEYAFSGCHALRELELPENVSFLYDGAFYDCQQLEHVTLPSKMSSFSKTVFYQCPKLQNFALRKNVDTKFYIEDGFVFHRDEDVKRLVFAPYEYIDYNDKDFYSENGILFHRKNDSIAFLNEFSRLSEHYGTRKNYVSSHDGYLYVLKNENKESVLYLPICIDQTVKYIFPYTFANELNEIHIPHPQPDTYSLKIGDNYIFPNKIRIILPKHLRKNITLYVPSGCKKYYQGHPDYEDFKEIKEDGFGQWFINIAKFLYENLYVYPWVVFLALLILCMIVYQINSFMDKILGMKNKNHLFSSIIFTLILSPIVFSGCYLSIYLFTFNNVLSIIFAGFLCLISTIFLTFMQRMTPKELWKNQYIKSLWIKWHLTKVLLIVAVWVAAIWGFAYYSEKRTAYIQKVKDTFEKYWKDSPSKAISYAYESQVPIQKVNMTAILTGHRYDVYSASFSPDGKRIVTASWDDTAMLWDAETGEVTDTLKGHSNSVRSASFSPDGKRIVTASWDDTAMLWDAETGEVTDTLKGHSNSVRSASFSPDGKRIVTASDDDTAMLWDAETGEVTDTLKGHSDDVNSASFSPDGKRIVTASWDDTAMLWDAETGEVLDTLKGHSSYVNSASFSPDGKRIVTASLDKTSMLWDAETGEVTDTLKGHRNSVRSASFSPDGKRIVTASWDNTAMLWDAETGEVTDTLKGHRNSVRSASFSPDGKRIVTASDDNTAMLWDVDFLSGEKDWSDYAKEFSEKYPLTEEEKAGIGFNYVKWAIPLLLLEILIVAWLCYVIVRMKRISFMEWSKILSRKQWKWLGIGVALAVLIGCLVACLRWYRKEQSRYKKNLITEAQQYSDIDQYEQATQILVEGLSKRVLLEDSVIIGILRSKPSIVLKGHSSYVRSASFSPDGKRIVTASLDDTAMLWNAETGEVTDTLKGHSNSVYSASFSPDGKRIVTASLDDTAMLWDAETGEVTDTLKGHSSYVYSASFSPDGKRIVTASWDDTAMLWDAETGEVLDTLKGHSYDVNSATFSPDGKRIVTASDDNTAMLWDAETGEVTDTLKGHSYYNVNSATFSPDGKRIVTASDDNTAMLWDAETGEVTDTLKGHSYDVNSATFSPDGKRIVTASDDDTAIIWILDDALLIDCYKRKAERNPLSAEKKKEYGIKWWLKW